MGICDICSSHTTVILVEIARRHMYSLWLIILGKSILRFLEEQKSRFSLIVLLTTSKESCSLIYKESESNSDLSPKVLQCSDSLELLYKAGRSSPVCVHRFDVDKHIFLLLLMLLWLLMLYTQIFMVEAAMVSGLVLGQCNTARRLVGRQCKFNGARLGYRPIISRVNLFQICAAYGQTVQFDSHHNLLDIRINIG